MKLNWANRITLLRILLILPFIILMLKINDAAFSLTVRNTIRYFATLIFLVMTISDVVDGFLARSKHQATRLGAFLDPAADKLLITSACLLLASNRANVTGFMLPNTVVVLIIGKDVLLVLGFVVVYFLTFKIHIVPVLAGKAATALQLSMVIAVLTAPEISRVIPGYIWLLRIIWWAAAAAAIVAAFVYIKNGIRFIEQHENQTAKNQQVK